MPLSEILDMASRNFPSKEAIVCGNYRCKYSELHERVARLAYALKNKGIRLQDRVAIIHRNCHYFLESYLAAAQIGAILVPVNYRLHPKDFSYILRDSDSDAVIVEPSLVEVFPTLEECPGLRLIIETGPSKNIAALESSCAYEEMVQYGRRDEHTALELQDTDTAQLYYTSGTTGKPKGVPLTHRNNYIHALNVIEEIQLSSSDRWLHVSPMHHLADAWSTWAITMVGGAHIFLPEFDPAGVLETIERDRITISNFIPTMLNLLVNHPEVSSYNYRSLRLIMSGGAPIAPEIIRKVIETFGCEYIQTYGMTETSPFLTMSILKPHLKELPFEERLQYLATAGRPFKGVDLKILRDNGTEVEKNGREVGEIVVKGDTITSAYWKLPDETRKRIKDGWLHTRDLATMNEEGYVSIVDRMDDMIITGGENVYSIEVENVLYEHPKVLEAAVIGIRDEVWGERIVAIIVPKRNETPTEEEIIMQCRKKLAAFKAPKEVLLVKELPKTESGKIRKKVLREKYGGKSSSF